MSNNNDYAGVFVEEIFKAKPSKVTGVGGAGVFLGVLRKGAKDVPMKVTSYEEFKELHGDKIANSELHYAVYDFFQEGGSECYLINPSFKGGATLGAATLAQKYYDTKAMGVIPINRSIQKTSINDGTPFVATKGEVLFNSVNPSFLDYASGKIFGKTSVSDLDLTSLRVLFNDTVVAIANSDGSFTNIASYIDGSGNRTQVNTTLSSIDLTADSKRIDETMVTVTPEYIDGVTTPTPSITVSLECTLMNDDLHTHYSTGVIATGGVDAPIVITTDMTDTNYGELTATDILMKSLNVGGVAGYHYNSVNDTLELVGAATTIGLNTVDTVISVLGGFIVVTIPLASGEDAVAIDTMTCDLKVNVSDTTAFFKNKEDFYAESANNFYNINSMYEANAYNEYFIRMSTNENYLDSHFNTVYVDADVMEKAYASDGVTATTPITYEDLSKMSLNQEDGEYLFTMFNDLEIGSTLLRLEANGQTPVVPQSFATIGNGSVADGYNYGNMQIGVIDNAYTDKTFLDSNNSLFEIMPGSVRLVIGTSISNTMASIAGTFQDNGIGGFYDADSPENELSDVKINYETGVLSGIKDDSAFIALAGGAATDCIELSFALTPLREYSDYSLVDGVGGTEMQNTYLSASVLTDSTLENQGRGIYALTKVKGKILIWGIPDLAIDYSIAETCMKYCDAQAVKTLVYVWNLDDSLTPLEAGKRINHQYSYRTKNAFVAYPFKIVTDIESSVIRGGKKQKISISNVGEIVGKCANRIATATPHMSIAGMASVAAWGIAPTVEISEKERGLLGDLIIPLVIDERVGGMTYMNDGSLADRSSTRFETVSDTLVFNTTEFELESLLWQFLFRVIDDELLGRIKSNMSRKLSSKTSLGWFGTYSIKDAFSINMDNNNTTTKTNREVFIDVEIGLPYSLKKVFMTISRKDN